MTKRGHPDKPSDPESIARKVQVLLRRFHSSGGVLAAAQRARVLADKVRPGGEGEFWYLPVAYQMDPNHIYALFEVFNRIEEKLAKESIDILIVPHLLPPATGLVA